MPFPALAEAAADAFTEGWRLSGCDAPFGEAEFRAAIGSALDCAQDPGILEATLDLGHLTGTWKTVYRRREKLLAKHLKAVLAAWDACMAELDPRVLVRRFRAVMDHTAEAVDTDRQWWKDAATTAAIGWLKGLYRTEGYQALVAAIEAAIRDGMAEGEADALALAASRQGKTGFAIAKAFRTAYDQLDGNGDISHRAADTIAAIVAGAASDAGRVLAAQAGDGGTEDDMTSAVDDTLTGEDARSPWSWTDRAIWAAIGAGAMALFMLAGIGSIAWYDVGDSRECQACMDNAAGSPYTAGSVPEFPAHPRCVIGSTRVSAPARQPNIVPVDEHARLANRVAAPGVPAGNDSGPLSTAAVTEAVGNLGQAHGRADILAVTDREYVGQVVTIRTALGHELTATPNHPVATRRGWVPIAELQVGDHVLSSTGSEWGPAAVDPDIYDVPSCIEDVAKAFPVLLGPMPTAPEDFHGDGAGSEVHVVRADRLLMGNGQPGLAQPRCEHQFGGRHAAGLGTLPLDAESPGEKELGSLGFASDSTMGGAGEFGALLGRGLGHAQVHGLAAPAGLDSLPVQPPADGAPAGAERGGQRLLALPGEVPAGDLGVIDGQSHPGGTRVPLAAGAHLDARLEEPVAYYGNADSEGFCERLLLLSGGVAADQVVYVKRDAFSGHVYNLETSDGWYIGNGIITHNCRCSLDAADSSPLSAFLAAYLS